jgi:hypothetical protein
MPKPYWPEHVKDDMKTAIIANRKYIVQDLQDVFAYKLDGQKFLKNRYVSIATLFQKIKKKSKNF